MPRLTTIRPRLAALDTRSAKPPPKTADPHYATPEHRAWRVEVVRRSGGMCQGRDCGRTGVRLFADHVVELKDGGAALDPRNGVALCGSCHSRKTATVRQSRHSVAGVPQSGG